MPSASGTRAGSCGPDPAPPRPAWRSGRTRRRRRTAAPPPGAPRRRRGVRAHVQPAEVRRARPEGDHHDRSEDRQHHRHDRPRQPRRLLNAPVVHGSQRHHRGDRHRVRLPRPCVRPDRQRHRRARRGLPHDERPARQIAPELAEPLPPVHIGPAGRRIAGGEPRRRHGVAVRDDRGQRQPQQQPRPGRPGRRAQRREDARPDHRPQPDHDRVEDSQGPPQLLCHAPHPTDLRNRAPSARRPRSRQHRTKGRFTAWASSAGSSSGCWPEP